MKEIMKKEIKNVEVLGKYTGYHDKIDTNKLQPFSEEGNHMKVSRLVVSAVSLAVSAALLTLSIIDLIRKEEY